MEDSILRCNNHSQSRGYCRTELRDVAIVTTCSHVICRTCAQESGFLTTPLAQRQCPACKSALPKPDDAAQTMLNPSEEYKTSVLSGLDPSTIMECASRALCFWSYQNLQETAYQKHLLSALTQKYSSLNGAMDKLVLEANSELDGLQAKVSALSNSNTELHQRNSEFATKDRERTKKFNDLRMMYDKLKQRYQAIVQTGSTSASAHRAIQSLTDNIIPQRTGIDDTTQIMVPQSAGGYFSARKHNDKIDHTFDNMNPHQPRNAPANPYNIDTRTMPPPARLGISPAPFGVSPSQRLSFPSPHRSIGQRGTNVHGKAVQSPPSTWISQNRQQLPNISNNQQRQGSASGYGGITAGMKIGSASTGDTILNRLHGI